MLIWRTLFVQLNYEINSLEDGLVLFILSKVFYFYLLDTYYDKALVNLVVWVLLSIVLQEFYEFRFTFEEEKNALFSDGDAIDVFVTSSSP